MMWPLWGQWMIALLCSRGTDLNKKLAGWTEVQKKNWQVELSD